MLFTVKYGTRCAEEECDAIHLSLHATRTDTKDKQEKQNTQQQQTTTNNNKQTNKQQRISFQPPREILIVLFLTKSFFLNICNKLFGLLFLRAFGRRYIWLPSSHDTLVVVVPKNYLHHLFVGHKTLTAPKIFHFFGFAFCVALPSQSASCANVYNIKRSCCERERAREIYSRTSDTFDKKTKDNIGFTFINMPLPTDLSTIQEGSVEQEVCWIHCDGWEWTDI